MSLPSDFQQRQQALDTQQSWIMQAPAGSGKTGILVYRMMKLLAVAKKPEEVLAITFTRKAAKEMRDRLIELLEAANKNQHSDDEFEQQGLTLAQSVLTNDAKRGWQLLQMPHRLNIETIDALCARLVSSMPWLSRLGQRPHTTEKPNIHFQFAVEQLLLELVDEDSSLQEDLQNMLLSLDNNFQKAKKLLIPMLGKRDQWLRHFLGKDIQGSRSDLEATWRSISETMLSDLLKSVPQGEKDNIAQLAKFAAQQRIDAEMQKAPRDRDPKKFDFPFKVFSDDARFPRADFADINLWLGIRDFLLTKKGSIYQLRVSADKRHGFPTNFKAEKNLFLELLSTLSDESAFIEQLSNISNVPPATFSEEQWQQLLVLERVLKRLLSYLQLRFHNAKECDFNEVSLRANQALSDLGQPTDLALRMDYQIQHILVDEFQDTSHAQSTLLENLTRGWQQGDGRSLFLVGDPMQSIYRFREADVGLFVKLSEGRGHLNDIELKPLVLSENFRSQKALVDWFNKVFTASFPKVNNETNGAITYSPASSHKSIGTEPQFSAFHSVEEEAEHIVTIVKEALARGDKKVAILVRGRSQLAPILPALNAAKISYQGIEIKPLNKTQDVLDVLSLCKALLRLDDKVSWLSMLRGPWLGLSLAEIMDIAEGENAVVWERLNSKQRITKLSNDSQKRVKAFVQTMRCALAQKQQVPLAALTQWTWKQLGGESCLQEILAEDLSVVWRMIQELEKGGDIEKISDLNVALDGLYAQPGLGSASDNSEITQRVIISTIHKSKGLQYDTVILPGLSRKGANNDKDMLRWAEVVNSAGQEQLLIAALNSKEQDNSHYNYLQNLETQRDANEQLRLLYVACTRAETNLYLSGTFSHKKSGELTARGLGQSLLKGIWPYVCDEFHLDELKDDIANGPQQTRVDQTLYRLATGFSLEQGDSINWQAPETPPSTTTPNQQDDISYDWASSIAQATGIVLHDWLEHHGNKMLDFEIDEKQKNHWRAEFQSMQLEPQQVQSAVKRMSKAVTNMQADSKAHWIFTESSHLDVQNEYAISTADNGNIQNHRIDRTFIDREGVRWIIDYKSTTHFDNDVDQFVDQQIIERGYKEQLERYATAFKQLEDRKMKLGIYFPLLKQWREWNA